MPRGRQYYDPIVQVPSKVEGAANLERIELYPEGSPEEPRPKWKARHVGSDGFVLAVTPGDFDHDTALAEAERNWPGLTVYELRDEGEDTTHDGFGPSPRLWQNNLSPLVTNPPDGPFVSEYKARKDVPTALEPSPGEGTLNPLDEQMQLRIMPVAQPGNYVLLPDILNLLEVWAVQYENEKNPSGALALREAVDALRQATEE